MYVCKNNCRISTRSTHTRAHCRWRRHTSARASALGAAQTRDQEPIQRAHTSACPRLGRRSTQQYCRRHCLFQPVLHGHAPRLRVHLPPLPPPQTALRAVLVLEDVLCRRQGTSFCEVANPETSLAPPVEHTNLQRGLSPKQRPAKHPGNTPFHSRGGWGGAAVSQSRGPVSVLSSDSLFSGAGGPRPASL